MAHRERSISEPHPVSEEFDHATAAAADLPEGVSSAADRVLGKQYFMYLALMYRTIAVDCSWNCSKCLSLVTYLHRQGDKSRASRFLLQIRLMPIL